jgi:hypothetical protein
MIHPPIASASYREAAQQDRNKKSTQNPSPQNRENRMIVQAQSQKNVQNVENTP